MDAFHPSQDDMEKRTFRLKKGDGSKSHRADYGIPNEVIDKFAPNAVIPILIPEGYVGRHSGAFLRGLPGLAVDLTLCPPGAGPMLHLHQHTTENFMCLSGRFRIIWGEHGEDSLLINPMDFCSVPPGVYRTFENVSDEPAWLLVLIQIPTEDQSDDVVMRREVSDNIAEQYGKEMVERLVNVGFKFAQ